MKSCHTVNTSMIAILGVIALAGMSAPAQAAWNNDNPAAASQCASAGVNNAASVVMNCLVSNARVGYLYSAGTSNALAPLTASGSGGTACVVEDISDATPALVVGKCQDANSIFQSVFWLANAPATVPTQFAALGGGVKSTGTALGLNGTVVGVSTDNNGTSTPVYWTTTGATASGAVGLAVGSSNMNCVPADVNNAASHPSIVGNCPPNPASIGTPKAVLWTWGVIGYNTATVLPLPTGASYCSVGEINLSGQMLGGCFFKGNLASPNNTPDTYRVVRWAAGGPTAPVVLATINSGAALRTTGADMNDSGKIACNYLAGGGSAGLPLPCFWDPATGTNATGITLPAGGVRGTVNGIGANGKMVGNYETSLGTKNPMHVASGATVAISDGTLGGNNGEVSAMSQDGTQEVGVSETASGIAAADSQPIP